MKRLIYFVFVFLFADILLAKSDSEMIYTKINSQHSQIDFNLHDYRIENVIYNGITYNIVNFGSGVSTNLEGFAELPFTSVAVQLNPIKNVQIKIVSDDFEDIQLKYPLLPSRGVIYRNGDKDQIPYKISSASLTDQWYPDQLADHSRPFIIRDVRGTSVKIFPFQYNAARQTLRIHNKLTIDLLNDESSAAINPLPQKLPTVSGSLDKIYSSVFVNHATDISFANEQNTLSLGQDGDLLVISTTRDEAAIEPYIEWKREKGILVDKEIVEPGTNVKSLIRQKYFENPNLLYVQLVGDWNDLKSDIGTSQEAPIDPDLGCVSGDDPYPDICIGRISANSPEEVTTQVNKIIAYERDAEYGENWHASATGIASDNGTGDDYEDDAAHIQNIWSNKLSTFTYDQYNPIYAPSADKSMILNALNTGTGIINYTGHGTITGWTTTSLKSEDVANLVNGDRLPLIFAVACKNGLFNEQNDCFAETWMKNKNGGAVGMLAASINQPWDPPMRGQDYFSDILIGGYDYDSYDKQVGINTSEQRITFGSVVFNGFALMLAESDAVQDIETVKTWTIFGDPSMEIRTKMPQQISLSNEVIYETQPFTTTVLTNGPLSGAKVTLSQNSQYFTGITDVEGSVTINHSLTFGSAKLVVTAFNAQTICKNVQIGSGYSVQDSSDDAENRMPVFYMNDNVVTCNHGLFFDSGGEENQYALDENYTLTFKPEFSNQSLKVIFTSFDVRNDDVLHVYDGSDFNAPEFPGSPFSGSTIPGAITATNAQGALTFYFSSNQRDNAAGWKAEIVADAVSGISERAQFPVEDFKLYPNYPNPFNPSTTIGYQLPEFSKVIIQVYNMLGQSVRTLLSSEQIAGTHELQWDGRNDSGIESPSGVYLLKIQAGRYANTQKLLLMR